MSVERPASLDQLFRHNASEKLPPEDLDLEKQCTGPEETKLTWWKQIWKRILSLIFKTEALAALSRADSNLSSMPNTRVHSNRPTIETVRETKVVNPVAIYTAGLTRAKPESQSIPTFEETIRVRSTPPTPPPTPDTLDPCQDGLLSDRELDDLISFIQNASHISPDVILIGRLQERDSTTIPPSLYHPHPVFGFPSILVNIRLLITTLFRFQAKVTMDTPKAYVSFFHSPMRAGLKHTQFLRIPPYTKDDCIADAKLRQTNPKTWVSENVTRVTSWLQEHEFDCHPVAPLGCGWCCLFDLDEETLTRLKEAGTCKLFDINDTNYPSLEYMEALRAPELESKAVWLMELREALSLFYLYTEEIDLKVLIFQEYLIVETNGVMEMMKQSLLE
ncbi:hypothetical protein TSTA_081850 [Talaromyces stipitatus ATCC 10500]|uniref:Uncharacterized protein n=1 Tax=Talaromyces stipitatus (strain ATCC 10500 / CBS 375.48 / QM 6759 / NRRL 1006) TaxID=441959 RepID=B8M020_TALSN|nr:uncharacterized protein TSTA_081850 [Talaromyces stipitatus ATCC 10500]EED20952.1 hypothetical protein TSTA_081850 [Talaromyces stipitatus ATCC 10500]